MAPRSSDPQAFLDLVLQNPVVVEVLRRATALDLPGWILTGGCLFQTVWNVLGNRPAAEGILDHDLFYFDASDLAWEAEDRAIVRARSAFSGCGGVVEVRNQARVHLWYESRFGLPAPPLGSAEAAVDRFVATACCVAVSTRRGSPEVYAPFGFADLYQRVLRPNRVLDVPDVYARKAERWQAQWPDLVVEPW